MIIKSVLNDLNFKSNRFNLLEQFKAINNKRINKINVYFNRFNDFNI